MTNVLPPEFQPEDQQRFLLACRRFDEENSRDPNTEIVDGQPRPRELVYAEWLTDWVLRLCPQASEPLRLAARCQHICRWMVTRESQPMTRAGYLKWREGLKHFHADKAEAILREAGYPAETITRVRALNLKRDLAKDPEVQVIEDALCLVFLEHQFAPLAAKTSEEKVIVALQKSWQKMSPAGREAATQLRFGPREQLLLQRALSQGNVSQSANLGDN